MIPSVDNHFDYSTSEAEAAIRAANQLVRGALDHLAHDAPEWARRGSLGRKIVAQKYGHERYLTALADMYRSASARYASPE